jgi:nitroreductase
LIRNRWSPRAFSDRAIDRHKLLSMLEAARWAPSSFNGQPWHFLVATKDEPEGFQRLLGCLMEGNQKWAKSAAVLMVAVSRNSFEHNEKANHHAAYDTGAAVAMMTIQAISLGVYVHQMAGFYPAKVRETFGVPQGYEPLAAIAAGYPGDASALPDDLRKREETPSTRKSIDQFIFGGAWGNKPAWL